MASVASPFGLRPINLIGGQAFNGGVIREYKVATNNSAAIFNGDLVVLSTAGLPSAVGSSPVAIDIPNACKRHSRYCRCVRWRSIHGLNWHYPVPSILACQPHYRWCKRCLRSCDGRSRCTAPSSRHRSSRYVQQWNGWLRVPRRNRQKRSPWFWHRW
jgi:hypothetical protein